MDDSTNIPIGLCQCGCGGETSIARRTDRRRDWIVGRPVRFLPGHGFRARRGEERTGPAIEPGDVVVPLTKGYYAVIDPEDAPRVLARSWCVAFRGDRIYARCGVDYLHRFIVNAPSGIEVDHVGFDGLNCRRRNIREADRGQQLAHTRRPRNTTSGFRGVRPQGARWSARIGRGPNSWLGTFDSAEGAARAFDAAARERYGEFAMLNFPDEEGGR